jgi:Zn-finger nucleic acid-binding protein
VVRGDRRVDRGDLIEVDCKSLKIDRCFACDGVWMDAGELEAAVGLEKGLRGEDPREVTVPRDSAATGPASGR